AAPMVESAPASSRSSSPRDETPTYALAPPVHALPAVSPLPPGSLMLSNGAPDVRLFPARPLARAFRRAIEHRGRSLSIASDACGHPRLRVELASMLARTRGLAATPDNLMVTRSIEQGIDL